MEKVARLKPDLIIAWQDGNSPQQLAKLRELGYPVFCSAPKKLSDVARLIKTFGMLDGTSQQANEEAQNFLTQLQAIKNKYKHAKKVTTFYQVWNKPLITVNNATVVGQAINVCGGQNIFGQLAMTAPEVTTEAVLAKNPEVILTSTEKQQELDVWRHWPQLAAVKSQQLYTVPADMIQRYTPRVLNGVTTICHALQQAREKKLV